MSGTVRTRITAQMAVLLGQISPLEGYRTDVGTNVQVRLVAGQATQAPVCYLTPEREIGAPEYGNTVCESTYSVTVIVGRKDVWIQDYPDADAEWVIIDSLIGDVRKALESRDATLEALIERLRYDGAEPAYREDAGELIGAKLTYSIQYRIAKGDPDNLPS